LANTVGAPKVPHGAHPPAGPRLWSRRPAARLASPRRDQRV